MRDTSRKNIELNSDDVRWFEAHYPTSSLNGVLSMLFTKFREANTLSPKDYAELAVKALMEEK